MSLKRIKSGAPLAVAGLLLVGCSTADQWALWEPEPPVSEYGVEPVEIPESLRPAADAPEVPLPPAGQVWELSLEEAIVRMLQGNQDLRTQQIGPIIAGAYELIERGVYDPQVFAELDYTEENVVQGADATSSEFSVEGEGGSASAGLRQQLPTGTEIELGATQSYSGSSRRDQDLYQTRVGLTLTQSLLRGFGPSVNLARIRQAERETEISLHELRAYTEELVADVESAYWRLVLAREQIAIFERSLAIARQQSEEIQQQIEVGLLPSTESAAARAEVALREQALIDARSELQAARLQLGYLLHTGERGSLDRDFQPTSSPRTEAEAITDLEQRVELARRSRPELSQARLQVEQQTLETVVTRNGLLPRLDFFVSLGRSGFANNSRQSVEGLDSSFYDLTAGLSLNHYLGNRAAEGRHLAARAQRQQAAAALANLEQWVALDVRLAATEVERARQQIEASAASAALREQAAAAEEERFEVGSSTALLVAQAQRDLLAARIAEVEAVVDYRLALIQLYLAEGSLLQRRGIDLAG